MFLLTNIQNHPPSQPLLSKNNKKYMIKNINGLIVCDKCHGQEIQFLTDEGIVCVKCYHEEKGCVEYPEFRSLKVVTKEQSELPF